MQSGSSARFGFAALCAVAVLVLIDVLCGPSLGADGRGWYLGGARLAVYAVGAVVAAMAAARFGWWREHVGRAWTLFAIEFVLLIINYLLRRTAPDALVALDATLIAANATQIVAYWLMARVLDVAGLSYLMSRGKKIALTVAALVVAILLCRTSLTAQWAAVQSGIIRPGSIVSDLADVITFTLVAPLAMSTLALRGGYLSWMFGFLTMSVFGWMINNDAQSIANLSSDPATRMRTAQLAGIALAVLFNAAAAVTQWSATRQTVNRAAADD